MIDNKKSTPWGGIAAFVGILLLVANLIIWFNTQRAAPATSAQPTFAEVMDGFVKVNTSAAEACELAPYELEVHPTNGIHFSCNRPAPIVKAKVPAPPKAPPQHIAENTAVNP